MGRKTITIQEFYCAIEKTQSPKNIFWGLIPNEQKNISFTIYM